MRVVVQRVCNASVTIHNNTVANIGKGLLILIGFESEDTLEDIKWLIYKIINLRIFSDQNQLMNLSLKDIDGDIILVSQFTLFAATKKGNRPSFIKAARPEIAITLYENFIALLEKEFGKPIQKGEFGADMQVTSTNDGPVTIWMDTKNKE